MVNKWSLEWRVRNDAEMRQLWDQMADRVMCEARVFSGLEPAPVSYPTFEDDIDLLDDTDLEDIGDLGDTDGE